MPGLIDCHVHVIAAEADLGRNAELPNSLVALKSASIMKSMLLRGFTTVRDLGGADIGLRRAVEENLVDAPRLVICGKALSQSGGHTDYRGAYHNRDVSYYPTKLGALGRVADGVTEVRRAAREELKNGAQFIKVMADGGVSSPSDPIGYLVFSVDELKAIVEVAKGFGTHVSGHLYADNAITRALDCGVECIEHGNLMSDETIARIAREGQVVVPTNIAFERVAVDGEKFGMLPESLAKVEDVRSGGLERLSKMHSAGIVMGYGSDLLGGMHDYQSEEFILRANHMPVDAVIRSATLDAAKVLRMEGKIGAIAAGAFADFIIVDGNPLKDISLLTHQGAHLPLIVQGGIAKKTATRL
ncbi:metal-dependent hydrolase family protein [Rhizobium rhizogenes]|uniref:metal-dependent hydrolase family protein n=1 Tax=Rhizobium rhizogenes TaxID=359 RepID=UPI001F3C3503|nr:amidohydrolase family protein [Rhizobium rhizogenes]